MHFFRVGLLALCACWLWGHGGATLMAAPKVVSPPQRLPVSAAGLQVGDAYRLERIAEGFQIPWGITFVDAETFLVSERAGGLYLVDLARTEVRNLSHALPLYVSGQGGLLDIAVGPTGQWVYVTYSHDLSPQQSGQAATALARFTLKAGQATAWQTLIVTRSGRRGGRHFGSRVTFDAQGYLYMSVGDRGHRPTGQDLQTHAGKILRLHLDGKVPKDNPFVGRKDALPEIWSYGHRNPQGLFYDAQRGVLWSIEHGPRGGDEINVIVKGGNYGWAVVSHGKEYISPFRVGEATSKPGMVDPVKVYIPSIAPSGLLVYAGQAFAQWQGQLFSGALKLRHLNQVSVDKNNNAVAENRLFEELNQRIRQVTQNKAGEIVFSTDDGGIYQIVPE